MQEYDQKISSGEIMGNVGAILPLPPPPEWRGTNKKFYKFG